MAHVSGVEICWRVKPARLRDSHLRGLKAIRRGVFLSVADLQASIEKFLTVWNQDPKPFVWTATGESIQEKLTRCRRTLEQIKPGYTSPKSRKRKK